MLPKYSQIEIANLSSYLRLVDNLNHEDNADLIFRGDRNQKPLLPKIAELEAKGKLFKIERLLMDDFTRQNPPFTEFETRDEWDELALAQHHGLPTRLLDWTYNSLAALWFCVNMLPEGQEPGTVWILQTKP